MVGKNTEFDVIIAGGGPAGLSALLWCADLGLNAVLMEKEAEFGGQLLHTHNPIRNYLGIEAANGRELRDIFMRQVENTGLKQITGAEMIKADLVKKAVTLSDGTTYSGRAIIVATGVRRRKLKVPGEEQFRGRGILESGAKAKDEVEGKTVLIAGGGDAAFENALIMSRMAGKVLIVHRRGEFTARREFVQRAGESKKIEIITDTQITAIVGKKTVEGVELMHLKSEAISQVEADLILIRIGVEPNTELFRGQIDLDTKSYVIIGGDCMTSLEGVFAVGDVADPVAPTVSAAAGHGATAVKTIFRHLNSKGSKI